MYSAVAHRVAVRVAERAEPQRALRELALAAAERAAALRPAPLQRAPVARQPPACRRVLALHGLPLLGGGGGVKVT